MHRLKSLFISAYMLALMLALVLAAYQLGQQPPDWAWWGVLLASGGPALFFGRLFLAPVARTSVRLGWMPVLGLIGTALALASSGAGLATALAGLNGVVLSLLYIHWYSSFGKRPATGLSVGSSLADFSVEDLDGRVVSRSALTEKIALWMFYRGNWCPLCMAQIREVAALYRELGARGVEVYLVSPQPQTHSRELAARFDVPMRFLIDRDNRAAQALGILAPGGLPLGMQALGYDADVPMPTVLITAAGGRIVYSDLTENYRIRPEPAEFIAALDRAGL